MKRCKIAPPSCSRPGTPCCEGCPDEACAARCRNSPELCGCWEETRPVRPPSGGKGRKSRLNPAEVLELHDQGLLQREIAQQLGCSISAVSRILSKVG